jgi:ferredoxin-NADP reductase
VGTAEPRSSAKRSLLALEPGEELTATSVGGDFVLPRNPAAPVLLIAAGIGITPYLAQLASARDRDVVLLYLAKNAAELAYAEELEHSGARVLARLADGSAPPPFMQDAGAAGGTSAGSAAGSSVRAGRPARLDGTSLKELVPDIAGREVFVSGSPASVRSLRAAARGAGARRIHVDSFAGY